MYAHDRYRTNQCAFIPPDEPVGIQPISNFVPVKFELHQNFPNPFNPKRIINYELRIKNFVVLKVYDIAGRKVATLVNDFMPAGKHAVEFNARLSPSYFQISN